MLQEIIETRQTLPVAIRDAIQALVRSAVHGGR
jgi:hypothetical protein